MARESRSNAQLCRPPGVSGGEQIFPDNAPNPAVGALKGMSDGGPRKRVPVVVKGCLQPRRRARSKARDNAPLDPGLGSCGVLTALYAAGTPLAGWT